jgi:glucokinase
MNLNSSCKYILSVDIGGSHVTAAVCDAQYGVVMPSTLVRKVLDSKGNADTILNIWTVTIKEVLKEFPLPIDGLAFAMPGPFDYLNGISHIRGLDKYEALFGLDIKSIMVNTFDFAPQTVLFRNDAEATIAGEVFNGAGRNYERVAGITLGTGLGSAIFEEGMTSDLNWGSIAYEDSVADEYFSTRWFLKRYYQLTGISISGVRELAVIAEKSSIAQEVFEQFSNNLAEFLVKAMKQSNPDVLLVCGNIAKSSQLFLPNLKKQLGIKIITGELGEKAALIGGAALFSRTKSLTKA